jgi:hypothetical protein
LLVIYVLIFYFKVFLQNFILLAHGRWFSPTSSTTKTGSHDIAEILLKVALKHQKSNKKIKLNYKQKFEIQ